MYVCMYVCMYLCKYVYERMYACISLLIFHTVHKRSRPEFCMCTHTHIHTYIYTWFFSHTGLYIHAYIHTCMHTCIPDLFLPPAYALFPDLSHTYIHTYIHTYPIIFSHRHTLLSRTYIHTYIHTCIPDLFPPSAYALFPDLLQTFRVLFP